MASEKESKVACSKVVGPKAATGIEEMVEEDETLSDTGKLVHICELEVGKSLSDEEDKGSKDLMSC
jgi:hypothetical protein